MQRDTLLTTVQRVEGDQQTSIQDFLAVEEPLELRLGDKTLSITMRTPGHDLDLAVGFLVTEGIIDAASQIVSLFHEERPNGPGSAGNTVVIELDPAHQIDSDRLQRNFAASSACGLCGKTSLAAIEIAPRRPLKIPAPVFNAALIHTLPEVLRQAQPVFARTGGLHAAARFSPTGSLLGLREDVGRHNALDKLIGLALRDEAQPLDESLVLISSRAGFEIVQKAVMVGIPVLAAVGAPSTLAVAAARRFGITLLGFLRDGRFNIYSGPERIRV